MLLCSLSTYQILSVGGGGMLTTSAPDSSRTSTVSSSGVLDISSNFFLMNSFSVAFWKYLDLAILSTNLKIFLPVFPPPVLWERIRGEERSLWADSDFRMLKPKSEEGWESEMLMEVAAIWSVMSAQFVLEKWTFTAQEPSFVVTKWHLMVLLKVTLSRFVRHCSCKSIFA